jgi:hypothetical protein
MGWFLWFLFYLGQLCRFTTHHQSNTIGTSTSTSSIAVTMTMATAAATVTVAAGLKTRHVLSHRYVLFHSIYFITLNFVANVYFRSTQVTQRDEMAMAAFTLTTTATMTTQIPPTLQQAPSHSMHRKRRWQHQLQGLETQHVSSHWYVLFLFFIY